MTDQQAFEQLKEFFETKASCRVAADPLRQNVEIGIIVNDRMPCAFYKEGDTPKLAQREAKKPDVIFYLNPDAVQAIVNNPSEDIGELGITICKQYLAGTVRIKVVGSMIGLLTNGYLGVIKAGGMSFAKFLGQHGISGLGKIKDTLQKMRGK